MTLDDVQRVFFYLKGMPQCETKHMAKLGISIFGIGCIVSYLRWLGDNFIFAIMVP
jgi:hypothetical protein